LQTSCNNQNFSGAFPTLKLLNSSSDSASLIQKDVRSERAAKRQRFSLVQDLLQDNETKDKVEEQPLALAFTDASVQVI